MTWVKAAALSLLAVLAPVKAMLLAALALTALDAVLGVLAARKRAERITSAGLRRTISKGLVYTLAIIAGHVAGTYLLGGLVPVASLVAGAIGIVECKSCLENASAAAGHDLFRAAIAKLGSQNDKKE